MRNGYEPGATVLAIQDGDSTQLRIFGEGVYVGDLLRPDAVWPCDPDTYSIIAGVVTQYDNVPIDEHEFVRFYDAACEAQPDVPPKQDRETMIADLLAEREKPLDDRVRDLWEKTSDNPCIYLDSGDIVWGFQCWWGPLDRFEERYAGVPRVTVPVPDNNERWKT